MTDVSSPSETAATGTALALTEAAVRLFGTKGFAATTTREIAAAAGTNVASIAYHFGGKEGLRRACAQEFARRMGAMLAALPQPDPSSPAEAAAALRAMIRQIAPQVVANEAWRPMIAFMLREVAEDGAGAPAIYEGMIAPHRRRLCRLWGLATGQAPESDAVRLTVFTLMGQMLYFRLGGPMVARRMGWAEIGPAEVEQIVARLLANVDALLAAAAREAPSPAS